MGLKLIRLELVRSKSGHVTDHRHSYTFQASLTPGGELMIDGYGAVSRLCKVIKSEPETGLHKGFLVLTSDGWMLSCDGSDSGHCSLNRLEARSLSEGDYVSITEDDGVSRTFEVVSVRNAEVEIVQV
jgi:hypothetical protein